MVIPELLAAKDRSLPPVVTTEVFVPAHCVSTSFPNDAVITPALAPVPNPKVMLLAFENVKADARVLAVPAGSPTCGYW